MIINNNNNKRKLKKCKRPGCNNLLQDSKNKHYCSSPICQKYRDSLSSKKQQTHENHNLNIPKNNRLVGKILTIRCGHPGCNNKFAVPYNIGQRTYRRYCDLHTNQYRRERDM